MFLCMELLRLTSNLFASFFHHCYLNDKIESTACVIFSIPILEKGGGAL